MAVITFKIDDSKAVARIRAVEAVAGNMTPVFATVGRVLANRVRLCFKLGIDPWGSPWAALRLRKGQPLRKTGRLQRSIVSRADATGVTVGTNVIYARTHQFGATIVPKKAKALAFPGPGGRMIFAKKVSIPKRSFLPVRTPGGDVSLPAVWAIDVTRALRTYFVNAAKA